MYTRRQDEIKLLFHGAVSRIHISNDLWSSTNSLSLLGGVALYKHRTVLLALPHIEGKHDGENQAESILKAADRYGIKGQLGTFTMDNASNNDTMVAALHGQVPTITCEHRLCCSGDIINLVVKALLYGEKITDFNKEIIECSDTAAFELWRCFGAIGKFHNTVKYIMRSDQRRQHFVKLQDTNDKEENGIFLHARLLVKDGRVCWISTYYMLYRAL